MRASNIFWLVIGGMLMFMLMGDDVDTLPVFGDQPTPTPISTSAIPENALTIDELPTPFPLAADESPVLDSAELRDMMAQVSEQQLIAYVQAMQEFGTRNSFSETQRDDFGVGATRRWLLSEFERIGMGRLQVGFQDFELNYAGQSANQRNVVATLPGVSGYPGAIVIGGHYDSRLVEATDGVSLSPSADDNASGIAMLLELARILSSRTWNQTIIFVAFASEEQGTVGSRAFIADTIIRNQQIDLAINNDTVGGRIGIPQSIRLFGPNLELSASGQVVRYMTVLNQAYQPNFPSTIFNQADREGRFGDQREFIKAGIGGVRITESVENPDLLNSPTDTWEKIDYSYLAKVVRFNLVTTANWAGAPPPSAAPEVQSTTGESYMLRWQPEDDALRYAIVVRPVLDIEMPELIYTDVGASEMMIDGLDPTLTYAISIAPIGINGYMGGFSKELLIP